jgi:hypothetical protein
MHIIGRLAGCWTRVDKDFIKAYRWLCTQMAQRGIELGDKPPIWAWTQKPDLRHAGHLPRGEQGVRLEFDIPPTSVLVSNFDAWHCILNDSFLTLTDAEHDVAFSECGYPRQDVVTSWERVFDLDACQNGGYGVTAQATFPYLDLTHLRKVQAFTGR